LLQLADGWRAWADADESGVISAAPPDSILRATPVTPQDFREHADLCKRLATTAVHVENRKIMLDLSKRWRELADADEARATLTDRAIALFAAAFRLGRG
jgi:hypothetical protein